MELKPKTRLALIPQNGSSKNEISMKMYWNFTWDYLKMFEIASLQIGDVLSILESNVSSENTG